MTPDVLLENAGLVFIGSLSCDGKLWAAVKAETPDTFKEKKHHTHTHKMLKHHQL